ncbi:23S rRNA (guanosine(2251)-2'-O)-methyltransferase RlmB [Kordiimonas aestuarii]|uniref:23S rRNA (guanosine(2251)-2'-O)-methyltransferase RlmB n=1 Tax=Kordiimonas aestuarii TaxID=1005925 RepID=UPI0021CFD290|nr:23S rRNA (guanosine(2251)-2'-O)-methyltransferase RlmB [Kordiimonas aestuarii]
MKKAGNNRPNRPSGKPAPKSGSRFQGEPRAQVNQRTQGSPHAQGTRSSPDRSHGRGHGGRGGDARSVKPLSPRNRDGFFLFGRHAVEAALKNPARECVRLIGSTKALTADLTGIRPNLRSEQIDDDAVLRASVPSDSPHQGILLEVRPLPGHDISELAPVSGRKNIILMLDQVTDPHNVGACIRSAAALGARALITQDRNSPGESGTLARASSGGLEILPWLRVANLSQTLDALRDIGYWHVGLDGHTETSIRDVKLGDNLVIVMGSEGKGLRPLVRKHCDAIVKIPMSGQVESLNVSNAAAIALYELMQSQP